MTDDIDFHGNEKHELTYLRLRVEGLKKERRWWITIAILISFFAFLREVMT